MCKFRVEGDALACVNAQGPLGIVLLLLLGPRRLIVIQLKVTAVCAVQPDVKVEAFFLKGDQDLERQILFSVLVDALNDVLVGRLL